MPENINTTGTFARLKTHVETVTARYTEMVELFAGSPISPMESKDLRKFIEETLSEIAMSYVVLGTFELRALDPNATDPKTAEARAKGFTVSGGSPETPTMPDGVDPAFFNSAAARAALEAGFDITKDTGDLDEEPLRPSQLP